MMGGLVRAEWLKVRRQPSLWLTIAIPLALAVLGAWITGQTLARFGSVAPAFPRPMLSGLEFVNFLGNILIVMLATGIVGSEYGYDTWKNLLTRRAGRGPFLAVKLGYALAAATAIIILVPLAYQLITLLAYASTAPTATLPEAVPDLVIALLVAWLRLAIAACIAVFTTVIARSSCGGLVLALPWLIIDGIVAGLGSLPFRSFWHDVAPYTFNYHLSALAADLSGGAGNVSPLYSASVLLAYTAGLFALAVVIFRRRDIAG